MKSTPILSYEGPLSFSTIDALLSEFKLAAQEHELSFKVYKKMLSVMIEALENISRYGVKNGEEGAVEAWQNPHFQMIRKPGFIELVTRNVVRNEEVEGLRSKIEKVNRSNMDELKSLYKQTLTNGQFSSGGGAGLGFIEMAKTTGNKLGYTFEHLNRNYSLYTLRTVMKLGEDRPS